MSSTWAEHEAVLQARKPFRDFEYRRPAPDGSVRYLSISGAPIFDAQGMFRGYQGVGRDITDRKRAEEKLRESEVRKAAMFESALDCIISIDHNGRVIEFNPAAERTFGYRRAEAMGRELAELIIPTRLREQHRRGLARYVATGEGPILGTRIEMPAVRADGAEFPVELSVTRIPAEGAPLFTAYLRDITERQRAADELRESEVRFRSLTELSSDWYWEQDEDLRFTYLSNQAFDLTGYSAESSLGKRRWEIANMTPLSSSWTEHQAVLAARQPFRDFETCRVGPDGTVRYLSISGAPIFDEHGRFKGYQGIGRNITERHQAEEEFKRLEQQLRQAQRLEAMGTLAGGIAHDFNNILGAILGYGEMALRDAAKGSRLRRDLDSIMVAGERGRALVDRILAFSRSGVGERVAVHVEKVVREALDLLAAKLPPNVTLHAKLHAGRAAMLGDPTQVHQVLMNLATNAIQAMPSGGTLRVSLDALRVERRARADHRQPRGRRLHRAAGRRHRHRHRAGDHRARSSIRSSPPRKSASAPASVCRWCTASSPSSAARSTSRARPARAAFSPSTCRAQAMLPDSVEERRAGRCRAATASACWSWTTRSRWCGSPRARSRSSATRRSASPRARRRSPRSAPTRSASTR